MFTLLFNVITRSLGLFLAACLAVNYIPQQFFQDFPFEPRSFETLKYDTVKPQWNTKLSDQAEYIQLNNIFGPESIAVAPNGFIYTGLADGRLVELNPNNKYSMREVLKFQPSLAKCKNNVGVELQECGRFLQLRFQNGSLFAMEASAGLFKIDLNAGTKTLIGPKRPLNQLNLYNSFAFDHKEPSIVYITISSTRRDLRNIIWSLMEADNSAQVIAMDVNTGKRVVVAGDLMMANGIDVDSKRDELIFSETIRSRILSVCLKEVRDAFKKAKDGSKLENIKLTELIPLVPGMPDNIQIVGDLAYIALPFVKLNGPELIDNLSEAPAVKKAYARMSFGIGKLIEYVNNNLYSDSLLETAYRDLKSGHVNYKIFKSDKSAIIEYNLASGSSRFLGSDKFSYLSEATPDKNGNLLLGSFRSPFLVKVKA